MSIIDDSKQIIQKINRFKQTMPSQTSLEFILELCYLNDEKYYLFMTMSNSIRNAMTVDEKVTKSINLWCQNLLEAGYDSDEIRICALESEPIIFNLCKKIITALKIQLPDELENWLLAIVLDVIYYNPKPRDYLCISYTACNARYAIEEILNNEKPDMHAHPLINDLREIHQQLLAICHFDDDYYRELTDALANYSNPECHNFYLRYSELELKNMIIEKETDIFHKNDKVIERLIQLMSGSSAMFAHPALRLM